jgi:hypothetical protein
MALVPSHQRNEMLSNISCAISHTIYLT